MRSGDRHYHDHPHWDDREFDRVTASELASRDPLAASLNRRFLQRHVVRRYQLAWKRGQRGDGPPVKSGGAPAASAAAAFAAILFGASVVAIRIAVRDIPPLTLALLRFGQGALVLFVGLVVFRRDLLRIGRRDVAYLGLLGIIFFTIFPVAFNAGMRYIEASRGALLLATMPLWTVVLARLIVHERLSPRQIAGVVLSVAGVAIVMADRHTGAANNSIKGDLLLLGTALCGATYNVLAKRMLGRYTGLTVTFYAMAIGTLFLVPASLVERAPNVATLGGQTIAMVIFAGVFGGALAFSLWTSALSRLSPTQVSVYINLNPLAATLFGATVLHERLSIFFAVGFAAVVAGVMIVNWTVTDSRATRPLQTDSTQT